MKNIKDKLNLEERIKKLEEIINILMLPIGTIIIGFSAPPYGVWSKLGILEEGQTIIGGISSNVEIKKHNHIISDNYETYGGKDGGTFSAYVGLYSFNQDGESSYFG